MPCGTQGGGKLPETQAGHLVLISFSTKFRKIKRAVEMAGPRCSSQQPRQTEEPLCNSPVLQARSSKGRTQNCGGMPSLPGQWNSEKREAEYPHLMVKGRRTLSGILTHGGTEGRLNSGNGYNLLTLGELVGKAAPLRPVDPGTWLQ